MRTTLSSARRGWPATSNKKNQRYGKDDQSDRTNDQSQQLGEKRDIRRCHRLWPLSDEVAQIMQGLSERAENRSNCYQSADDHRYQAYSTTTYSGHVTIQDVNGILQVTWTIDGQTDKCVVRFDTVAGDDKIPVLRIHFHFDGKEYDATYRWQSDPDNYPRFTGYVYLPGTKSPGLEALFPIHR